MNYARFAIDFHDEFREAYEDIDMSLIGALLDAGNLAEIGKLIWLRVDAMKESVEDDFTPGGEYATEEALDRRDRTRECNRDTRPK